ncbi:hypothetical protein DH2020_037417 [Rehmannia glutinosa]|uniref:Cyclic nucleotide-binding domain-containing protein n=1 Tax=Rehmannia glutinosa TaxID=99300 RepID=A0ABR0V3I0_REHGL
MLRMHSGRSPGFPLHQLRRGPPAGVGGLRRFLLAPHKKSAWPENRFRPAPVDRRFRPADQARAAVEPGVPAGAWHGAGGGPAFLLRAVDRAGRVAVLVHGRRTGGGRDGGSHVRGRGAFVPSVAAVPAGVRVEGVAGRVLVSSAKIDQRGADKAHNDNPLADVPVPIPTQGLSQYMPNEKNAKSDRLYLRHNLVAGGCWYVLAIQRVASCLKQQCNRNGTCNLSLSCSEEVCYQFLLPSGTLDNPCGGNSTVVLRKPLCLDVNGPFRYGIYKWALPVVSSNSVAVKILYPIFWGLMTLSTFGNDLEPTSNWLEVMFSISTVLSGLMLFTLLIGNIQVFLHAVMAKKRKMQLRCRDMEWWMRRRQLPAQLRQRVRRYERQKWATLGCDDEMELIKDLPEGLRRDIKRFLCLELIKKVPLFHSLDDLILDNICDRVKPLIFSKDEKIIREGDPVPRIVFIVHGRVKSSQKLSRGLEATCLLKPGGFFGDELFSWCLRRPFIDRLPASSATFTCIESTEAFALEAKDLRYITDHFRYKFANERLTRTARYYSSNWRTWAAVNIQLAWRRFTVRTRRAVTYHSVNGDSDRRLRQYAAFFMSVRPHDHLE